MEARVPSSVMAGLDPAIHALAAKEDVDARHEAGMTLTHGTIEIGEKSTSQLFGCTRPLIFGLIARGPTSWAT